MIKQIHCGDNLEVMHKMPDEAVDLIYLDPPFFSGKDYEIIWKDGTEERSFKDTEWYRVECSKCNREVVKAERFCPICGTNLEDAKITRKNDIYAYIDWMVPRLTEMHRILKPTGSIYLHVDWHAVHYLKVEMDRIFGYNNFQSEIIWKRKNQSRKGLYGHNHDTIIYYTKTKNYIFNTQMQTKIINNPTMYNNRPCKTAPGDGYSKIRQKEMLESDNAYITKNGKIRQITYLNINKNGVVTDITPCDNIWLDIPNMMHTSKFERLGYPTQKPEALLERIIKASSNEGDIVFDPFCGCGTTLAVASRFKRQFIGIDISPTSCIVIAERIKYNGIISGMAYTDDQYLNMEPHEFQNIVCNTLQAKNTSPNPEKASGADGGIDGIVKSKLINQFGGSPIQVKRSKGVGINTIKNFESTMRDNNKVNGFVVAISFGKGAKDQVKNIKSRGINIILIKAKELNTFDFNNYQAI